ncbi:MAG: hypothetical protein FWC50_06850 [Planctomycetaceae bacterium]|nr:hypothetical protein [Planctomycetaceae bacterium]
MASPATQGGCARPKAAAHTGCGISGGKYHGAGFKDAVIIILSPAP